MSQVSLIEVVVVGLASLLEAAAECGLQVLAEHQLKTADGKTHQVDTVLAEGSLKLGVVIDPHTKVASFVPQDCEAGKGRALAQRVAQRYAYSRIVSELKRKGYQLGKEEKETDGTLKLVASRWK